MNGFQFGGWAAEGRPPSVRGAVRRPPNWMVVLGDARTPPSHPRRFK
jgi:hypothetical protein